MGPNELVALVGVYILVGGVIGLVIQPSMQRLIEVAGRNLTSPDQAGGGTTAGQHQDVDIWEALDIALGVHPGALARLEAVGLCRRRPQRHRPAASLSIRFG
jgi:hypothetical protein